MRSTAVQFREEAAAYWAGEGRNESPDPWAVARRNYFRFLAGAKDDTAIDGWCAVMDRRQQAFASGVEAEIAEYKKTRKGR